ncbi:required for meiotic nuclear division protein 1 [Alphaproteobacteria bacterium]
MGLLQCSYYCTGEGYSLLAISEFLTGLGLVHKIYGKDVLHVDYELLEQQHSDIFIFNYGCVVFWGFDTASEEKFIQQMSKFLLHPLLPQVVDRCHYVISKHSSDSEIDTEGDKILLHDEDPYVKLSFSYGLSQSVKLIEFEDSVEKTIEENREIPYELIETGKISLSRRTLAKKIGVLFAERNFINLNSNILDTPDFFWKRPRYEPYYEMSIKFMDIKQRTTILNDRLNIIHELYEMLSTELQHAHSCRLELIIMLLILIEVSILIMRDLLGWI